MGQSPSQIEHETTRIEHEIGAQRVGLEIHMRELESKLSEATDWRTYVRRKPFALVGGAFGFGLLTALMFGKR